MRSPRLLVLGLLALLLGLALPASAAGETLTASPVSGPRGTAVGLTYDPHYGPNQCSPNTQVRFKADGTTVGESNLSAPACTATLSWTVPAKAACGAHRLQAVQLDGTVEATSTQATTTFTVTCPVATKSPTPSPTPSPRRSATASPTPSPTASPTASPTPSPTPSPTRSATPSPTPAHSLPATASPTPLPVGTAPNALSGGTSPGAPWVVGGIALGLVGLGVAFGVLRPRGAGTPAIAAVSAVSVLAGAGLALKPLTDPVTPVVLGSYSVQGATCADGDIPVTGGFHVLDVPPQLLHFEPSGGAWDASPSGTGESWTVCLRLGRSVPWTVRTATLSGGPAKGSVSCQTPEQLLGGGFYVPWGLAGREGTHPEPPSRWSAVTGAEPGDLPPVSATVSALCAELPDGIKTYTTTGTTTTPGTAVAHCFAGDVVLGGGYAGDEVHGSHPVDGGWQAEVGTGGGSAYALCVHPSRALGIRSTYVRQDSVTGDFQATADCDGDYQVLAGGWTTGHGISAMQHFRPDGNSWVVALPDRGDVTAYVLCARRYA